MPASGVNFTGSFADGQTMTVNLPTGGLGARSNPLPLYYWPMGEDGSTNLSTHATLSRTSKTLTASNANTLIQSSVMPVNALGACQYIPSATSGQNSQAFADNPIFTFVGGAGFTGYAFIKHQWAMSGIPDNDKMFRVWTAAGFTTPDIYNAYNSGTSIYIATVENNDNATNLPGGQHYMHFSHAFGVWQIREHFWQENSYGNSDGIINMALNSQLGYPTNTTFGPCNSNNGSTANPTGAGPMTSGYLDQYSVGGAGHIPNFTTDTGYFGIIYVDDSFLQLIVTAEGPSYQTAVAGSGGVDYAREIQIQTARSDQSITFKVRKGSHVSLTGKNLLALTGYGTAINLGVGA